MFLNAKIDSVTRSGLIINIGGSDEVGFINKFNLKATIREDFPNNIKTNDTIEVRPLNIKSRSTQHYLFTQAKDYQIGEEVTLKMVKIIGDNTIFESKDGITYKINNKEFGNEALILNKSYMFFVRGINRYGNPLFRWKQYIEGGEVELMFHSDGDKYFIYKAINGLKFSIKKTNWEIIPTYKLPAKGDKKKFLITHY